MGTSLQAASGRVLACVLLALQQTAQGRSVEPAYSSVLVMRHCHRSVTEDSIHDVDGLLYFDNYSQTAWPRFGVPEEYCLPRGAELVELTGGWLAKHGDLPKPIRVIADDCERDWETASRLLQGMQKADADVAADNRWIYEQGRSIEPFLIANEFFAAAYSPACPELNKSAVAAAIRSQIAAVPPPADLNSSLKRIGEVLGVGAAGEWWTTGCRVGDDGYVSGACEAGSEFIERLLFEWGGGFPLGWGRITPDEIPSLLKVHAWFRTVTESCPAIERVRQAPIIRAVLDILEANEQGTTIFVGHDSQMNGLQAGLGLQWNPPPFPVNATLPGSMLRFDRAAQGSNVSMTYSYIANFSVADGVQTSVPATLTSESPAGPGTADFNDFKARSEQGSDPACVRDSPPAWGLPLKERKLVRTMSSLNQARLQV